MFQAEPIGFFHSECKEKYSVPSQPNRNYPNHGFIQLNSQCQFEQALEGLEDFNLIWILFWFHQNSKWKPKVLPPRGNKKRGVFATRAPHRPNFIGLSCVELHGIEGLKLIITNHDLLDGTPILDIKPYINYADSLQASKQGWLEELPDSKEYIIEWAATAEEQCNYLLLKGNIEIKKMVETRLKINPFPSKNNRIKKVSDLDFELSYKEWRIYYVIDNSKIVILNVKSGYTQDLDQIDLIHHQFNQLYNS